MPKAALRSLWLVPVERQGFPPQFFRESSPQRHMVRLIETKLQFVPRKLDVSRLAHFAFSFASTKPRPTSHVAAILAHFAISEDTLFDRISTQVHMVARPTVRALINDFGCARHTELPEPCTSRCSSSHIHHNPPGKPTAVHEVKGLAHKGRAGARLARQPDGLQFLTVQRESKFHGYTHWYGTASGFLGQALVSLVRLSQQPLLAAASQR